MYNFELLSPTEFEDLSRDLIQSDLQIRLESFTNGRDNGIDFRYSPNSSYTLILQCKRYKSYSSLFSSLKKEILKVKQLLWINDYILTTSVGLTPKNKASIIELFEGKILSTSRIYGKDDLNNLLGIYNDIEIKYPKLWLAHGDVITRLINKDLLNRNQFFFSRVKNKMRKFIQDENYHRLLKFYETENFAVISGPPGSGKSMLKYAVSYWYSIFEFEVVVIGKSIKDAYKQFDISRNQIFVYDDFLGENVLDERISPSEQIDTIMLIDEIRNDKSKLGLFVSRNYLLSQAITKYEKLHRFFRENRDCVFQMNDLSRIEKAKLLASMIYNEMIDNKLNISLNNKDELFTIINHDNFSPRLVEGIVRNEAVGNYEQPFDKKRVLKELNNPIEVWQMPFENDLDSISRDLLILLVSLNGYEIKTRFITKGIKNYALTEPEINKSLKQLENAFIKEDSLAGQDAITIINPSIRDFVIHYLEENKSIAIKLLQNSFNIPQLTNTFAYGISSSHYARRRRVILGDDEIVMLESRAKHHYHQFKKETPWEDTRFVLGVPYFLDFIYPVYGVGSPEMQKFVDNEIEWTIRSKFYERLDEDSAKHWFSVAAKYHNNNKDGSLIDSTVLIKILDKIIIDFEDHTNIEDVRGRFQDIYDTQIRLDHRLANIIQRLKSKLLQSQFSESEILLNIATLDSHFEESSNYYEDDHKRPVKMDMFDHSVPENRIYGIGREVIYWDDSDHFEISSILNLLFE